MPKYFMNHASLFLIAFTIACALTACQDKPDESNEKSDPDMSQISESNGLPATQDKGAIPDSEPIVQEGTTTTNKGKADKFASMAEVHQKVQQTNPGFKPDNAQVNLAPDGTVAMASFAECGISNIGFLSGWPMEGLDLRGNPVSDLTPLKGMQTLKALYIERTNVSDLRPLFGLPIQELYINDTPVKDIMPLIDMPLVNFNAVGTGISDILPLARSPIQMLWLSETQVTDISPLIACPLVSLTLHRTPVSDISPLAGSRIQRLHIAESNVTDITPVLQMRLSRLIFSPERISTGLDQIRSLPISEIGTTFESRSAPAQFWAAYPPQNSTP